MRFGELKVGDIVYLAEIKELELIGDCIKKLVVKEIVQYKHNSTIEVHFTNDTLIIVNADDTYLFKGGIVSEPFKMFDMKLFTCTYETCLESLKKVIDGKLKTSLTLKTSIDKVVWRLRTINATLSELSIFLNNEKKVKENVVSETVYTD